MGKMLSGEALTEQDQQTLAQLKQTGQQAQSQQPEQSQTQEPPTADTQGS
jgi:hypothetical protein